MIQHRLVAAVVAVITLAIPIGLFASHASSAATTNPCDGLQKDRVASAFGLSKIDVVTRGKQEFGDSCFFSARTRPGSCGSQFAVFISTKRYRDKAAAAAAFADLMPQGQSIPAADLPAGELLATEQVSAIGDAAYYTNRRGGMIVVRKNALIRAFGGGTVIPSTAVGCDEAAIRLKNRNSLTRLATKVTPPPKSPAPSTATASGLIDACALVTPVEAGTALGGTYSTGTTPDDVKGWKPDKLTKGYGVCQLPAGSGGDLLHIQVWRYATNTAAAKVFRQSVDAAKKRVAPVVMVSGVGDSAAFCPAHRASSDEGKGVVSPVFQAVAGQVLIELQDARSDHTSPDGRTVADQTGESDRLAKLATTALGRLP